MMLGIAKRSVRLITRFPPLSLHRIRTIILHEILRIEIVMSQDPLFTLIFADMSIILGIFSYVEVKVVIIAD